MNEAEQLQRLIERLQKQPNSLHRNKAVSHGHDMLAHMQLMDQNRLFRPPAPGNVIHGSDKTCICREGEINLDCPVHSF